MSRTITDRDYDRLVRAEKLLIALQECGVDNWEGYSEAVRLAFGENEDDSDE